MVSSIDKLAKELKKQMTASDERKPKPYDTQAEVLRVEDGVAWVHIPGGVDETPVRLTINAKKGDNVNLHVANGTAWITGNSTNPPTDDSTANYAVNISNEVKKDITVLNTVVAENIEATNARFINVEADTAKIHTLTAEKILATVGYIEDLTADSITANDISAASGYIKDLEADNITAQDISAASGYIKDLEAENITAQDITADHATVGSLDANYAKINMANVNNAWIENGAIKKAEVFDENVFDLSGNRATLSRIDASKINVANLRADNLVVRRINGQPVVGGYTLIDSNSPGYSSKNPQALGWYEFVNAEWVLSTDTTVDMTKAYYQEGNEVSLYDQAYIDALEDDLQQQIDGAVETYTGTVVPTLVNKPYTDWYDTSVTPIHDERAKHIGDIYYVVNSAASENGYCYRFAYDNTSHAYSWVLIKDSDVTKALSDISELKTFESNTTSWMDETDEGLETIRTNHTALSGVVDKTVKESVQLWFTKANTTAPAKPTAEVTSTSTAGNAWRKVVPAWNASYPNYYYCWQYKFVDGTFGWSDVVRDIAMGETQGTARDAKNTADAALPASTFTSFESTTFKNVKDTVDEQSTKFTNMTTRLGMNSDGTGANTDIVAKESALEQTVDGISTRVGKTETKLAGMYATSSTAAGTAAKVATITPALPSGATWELGTGTIITVKFTNANTAASPTLNVNSKGAKAIKTYANGNLTEAEYKWKAGSTFTFTYNGTNWLMQDSSASVRMNSAETGITQNAEQIALRAKSSDVYTKGQVYTKTEADSAITQKANEISLSVAQTEISKIEVGGRNLLTSTSESTELTTAANQSWFNPRPYKLSAYANTAIADTNNTNISISFDYSITGVDTAFNMVASLKSTSSSWNAAVKVAEIPVGSSSGHAFGSRNITDGMRQYAPNNGILISGSGNANANAVVTISNVKLEFGNKATDWSPAPEDLEAYTDSQVSAAKAEIKVTTDGISTEVEKKTDKSTIISTIRQSAETVKIKASQVEINGTAIFNAIKSSADAAYDVKGAADSINVGGRNLWAYGSDCQNSLDGLNNPSNGFSIVTEDGYKCAHASGALKTTKYLQSKIGYVAKPSETFTYSCYVKIKNIVRGTTNPMCEFYFNGQTINGWKGLNTYKVYLDGELQTGNMVFDAQISDTKWHHFAVVGTYANADFTATFLPNVYFRDCTGDLYVRNLKAERGNKATDWTPAPEDVEAAAVAEEQYIYISKASGTTSVSGTTTWITETGNKQNTWSTKRPTYNSSYPVLFVAKQKKVVSGTVTCTTPIKDDTTTIIDGGHITTGTIDTNRLNADTIKSNIVQTTDLNASKITSGDIAAARMKVNSIAAINSLTTGKIDAARINVGQITVGSLSDGSSYSTTTQMNTAIDGAVNGHIGGRNLILNSARTRTSSASASNSAYISPHPVISDYGLSIFDNTDDKWTCSFDYEVTGNSANAYIYILPKGSTAGSGSCVYVQNAPSGHYSYTFKLNAAQIAATITQFRVRLRNATDGAKLSVSNMIVERGDKETHWSAAPEDYITDIDGTGIRVHTASTENNSVLVNAEGVYILKGGTDKDTNSVAFYGDTARIGKESGSHLTLAPDLMSMSDGNKNVFNLIQKTMYIFWTRNYKGRQFANSTDRHVDSWETGTTISTWDSITVNYKLNNTSRTKKITSISNGVLANDEIYVHFNYSGTIITLTYGRGSSAASSDIIKLESAVVYYVTDEKLSQLHTGTYPNTTVSGALRIGNGTSDSNRRNLMLVDWSGTGKFKGDILAFCGADSSGGMSLTKAEENIDAFKYEDANGHVYIDAYRVGRIVSLLCSVRKTPSIAPGANLYQLNLTNAHLPKPLGTNTSGTGIYSNNMIIGNIYYNKTVTPNRYEFICRNGGSTAVSTVSVGFSITYICQMDEVSGEIKYMDD